MTSGHGDLNEVDEDIQEKYGGRGQFRGFLKQVQLSRMNLGPCLVLLPHEMQRGLGVAGTGSTWM